MPSHLALKDNQLLCELYSGMASDTLLLETPATPANIQRFIKKYIDNLIPALSPQSQRSIAVDFLNQWTPKVQQTIKAAGGNPDVFGYSGIAELQQAFDDSAISRTDIKKGYKQAADAPKVYETDEYVIYQPHTWEASRKFFGVIRLSLLDGQRKKGSQWCTAASTPKHFQKYVEINRQRLLYFARKKDDALFAARCRNLSVPDSHSKMVEIPPGEAYKAWLERSNGYGVSDIYDAVDKFKALKGDENSGDKGFQKRRIHDIMQYLAPENLIIECRNQLNFEIKFRELFYELTDPQGIIDNAEKYIQFIKFVVFGEKD